MDTFNLILIFFKKICSTPSFVQTSNLIGYLDYDIYAGCLNIFLQKFFLSQEILIPLSRVNTQRRGKHNI